jgi:hypothetical protein
LILDLLLRVLRLLGAYREVINSFYMQVNLGGGPTNPGQATTYQIVTPWGQTATCYTWEEAVNQAFGRSSKNSGRQGNYFEAGTTNGLTTNVSGSMSANDINSTP